MNSFLICFLIATILANNFNDQIVHDFLDYERDQDLAQVVSQTEEEVDANFLCDGPCGDLNFNHTDAVSIKTYENTIDEDGTYRALLSLGLKLKAPTDVPACYSQASTPYLCPNTQVCTNDYNQCTWINSTSCNSTAPYKCGSGNCVSNMATQCCPTTSTWCPYSNQCVSSPSLCCSLNAATPFYCKSTSKCVQYQWQCCSNLLAGTGTPLVKCSNEKKCAPANNSKFCFTTTQRACPSAEFTIQCPNDGLCVRNLTQCPSPKVCSLGYYMCPNGQCLPGLAQQSQCSTLPTCFVNGVQFLRCSDGMTCVDSYDKCPTQISCLNSNQVLCPDGTCADSSFNCIQPPSL